MSNIRVVDLPEPHRVFKTPDCIVTLLGSSPILQDGFQISRIELRLYVERTDASKGKYSLITSFVETDQGTVEMIYDEGFRGPTPLGATARLLTDNLGVSALVLRSLLSLQQTLDDRQTAQDV